MRCVGYAAALGLALAVLVIAPVSSAVDPPNPNDPCSAAGRNTCGTLGVGFYDTYRYGLRWFGDFRGAVPDEAHTYCLDLGFWYPAARYRFRESSGPLRNRTNEAVSLVNQQRMAFALWSYGRTTKANQAAAVMLYVHSLMGDARPGEIDPAALNPTVVSLYERIARDSARLHGPYRLEVRVPAALTVGQTAAAEIRVATRAGVGLPDVRVALTARGATGVPESVQTNDSGVARVMFTASAAGSFRLSARSEPLASTLPRVLAPTTAAAARNGQRLVAPGSQTVEDSAEAPVSKARLTVSSVAVPNRVLVGEPSRDRVTIGGALRSYRGRVAVRIHGPFPSEDAIRCDGTPAWSGALDVVGSGVFTTPPAQLERVGWYAYVEVVPGDASHVGVTTPCRAPGETFRVETQPRVQTVVSAQRVQPGTAIHDRVMVSGLAGQRVTVLAALYGPFASREEIRCTGTAVWSGTIDAAQDGEYRTPDHTVTVPGYYTYVERIAATGFVRAAEVRCGEVTETTVVVGAPQLRTAVSSQRTRPGAPITDRVVVSGIGVLAVPVRVLLWGPFATRGAIACTGTPFWTGTFTARGDGTYTTAPVRVDRAGYYTYQESIAESPATPGVITACADVAETTFARAVPTVTTLVSDEVVVPGSTISDRLRVGGLGRTEAAIDLELFGPFASRAAISCSGRPAWRGRVFARGDGVLRSPPVRIARAGFYTYRERLAGSATVAEHSSECALVAETTLGRPQIVTGRGDPGRYVAGSAQGGPTPSRVRIGSLGIDAPVLPAVIDTRNGVLAAPTNIGRTGWWRDGMAPGARTGAILIAGHVDSARAGPGAFFRLREASAGDRIQVETRDGRTFTYRVVSNRTYAKERLPADVYSRRGRARLVLVTCGGPFLAAQGHYRDNIVVTAVPA